MASGGGSRGIAFLVAAGIMAEIIAKACSSPQTTELNAGSGAPTLMKWVNLGLIEVAACVIIVAEVESPKRWSLLLGGLAEGAVSYAEYVHGKRAGLASSEPGTESHDERAAGSFAWA